MATSMLNANRSNEFRLLVHLHNIVNLPNELATGSNKVFAVVISNTATTQPSSNGKGSSYGSSTPDVSASFSTMVDMTSNERLEARFDSKNEWLLSGSPIAEVTATVYEIVGLAGDGGGGRSVVAVSQPISIDARQIIEFKKISTRIIGTSMGQIGVSFSVSPSDEEGYTARLTALLQQHNPEGMRLVPQVVKAHSEIEAFNKIYNKYGLVDYRKRITEFFRVYGEDYMSEINTILAENTNKEEELMRNLILDNGPELSDVDIRKRLAAFAERHGIRNLDVDTIAASGRRPEEVLAGYVADGLAEPDPRTYCFPTVFYNGPSNTSNTRGPSPYVAANANSGSLGPTPSARPPLPYGSATPNQHVPTPAASQSPFHQQQQQQPPPVSYTSNNNNNNNTYYQQPYATNSFQNNGNSTINNGGAGSSFYGASNVINGGNSAGTVVMSAAPSSSSPQLAELWSKLCEDLRTTNVPLSDLHYLDEASFDALLTQLAYPPHARAQLTAEWLRRVRSSLRQETLSAGDSLYEAARRDVLTIGNLLPLNVSVVGVVSVKNSEHEANFSLRLNDAKVRATERLLLIGDYTKLLSIAVHGVCPSGQRIGPATIFYRNPLAVYHRPTSVSMLVCDVVVGKPQVIPEVTPTPYDATDAFLREYDSCVFTDPVHGRAIAVYSPQQVLPRYIVHANVDNSITPCPANPERPVEYLVVENNAFACSQCVVMGQYRGKEVIPIDEAATQARTQLSEMHRDAESLVHELKSEEEVCVKTIDSINKGDIRLNAEKIAEQIRREAEQRIQQLMLEAEDLERTQLQSVSQQKQRLHTVLLDAQQVSHMLHEKATRSATSAIESLLQLRLNNPVAPVRQRASGVLAQQQAVHELSNNNAAGLVGLYGSSAKLNSTTMNNNSNTTVFPQGPNINTANNNNINNTVNANIHNSVARNTAGGPVFEVNGISGRYAPTSGAAAVTARAQSLGAGAAAGGQQFPQSADGSGGGNRAASLFRGGMPPSSQQQQSGAQQLNNDDLFNKYMALKNDQSALNNTNIHVAAAAGLSSSSSLPRGPNGLTPAETKLNKDQMTRGWSEFRKGDRSSALATWLGVYERNQNNSTGARAKAYIAEAIERDYDAASRWYEKALSLDPSDVMSLYNYGVLLESVLGRKREAMQLFDTAYRYGDQTAGKRAQAIRVQLGL